MVLNDQRVLLYRWTSLKTSNGRKSKQLSALDLGTNLGKVSFHPIDSSIIVVSGQGILRQFYISGVTEELEPGEFEYTGFPKPISEYTFSDHLWTEENQLFACTRTGELFSFNQQSLN